MIRRAILLAVLVAAAMSTGAGAATTTHDASGTVLLDGRKVFPIVLAKGPDRGGTTLDGHDAIAEVVGAGVTFLKIGPATVPWTDADIADAKLDDADAAAKGAYTWVNLSTVSRATAGSASDALLQKVVGALEGDPAVAMWKGADEPWWSGFDPASLQFSYCRSTGRGQPGWCGGEPVLDRDHDWVTIQAPRGQSTDLAPYSGVTDVHGVDVYPVTLRATDPNLHDVGSWTSTMASITPSHSVWTTLQICASGSYDTSTGEFVLPTRAQERYMIYDAIINGARMLAFFGGNNPRCWNAADADHAWSWTFWNTVLKGLIGEINAISPLAPALVNVGTTQALHSSDATTQVISRAGNTNDLWVMAARGGTGTASVTIDGIPPTVTSGTVYTEGRSVSVANGSFTDDVRPLGRARLPLRRACAAAAGAADDLVVRADLGRGRDARHDRRDESRRRDLRHLRRFERRLHAGLADRTDRDRTGRGDDRADRGHDAGWDGDELLGVHGHRAGAAVRVAEPGR